MTENETATAAGDFAFSEGPVWSVQFARTKPGLTNAYLANLRAQWKPLMEEAKRQKLIRDYRIVVSPPTGRDDWNVMIVTEVENMAALDGYSERMADLSARLDGPDRPSHGCAQFRELLGMRLAREVFLK
ncbi:hypothetical protein AB0E96_29475 [Kitasatospora sp. NPDC036755]|uniref:hypothetical protein n=1 Tax=Kitasatospora sp. NPDC036755 TaxID=3154600 RepID=UPI0033DFC099